MNDRDMVIQTESLRKRFGRVQALDGLSLDVRAGEVLGFLGPNGAGKTTTMRLLMGYLRPTAGSARVYGLDCWRDSVAVHARTGYLARRGAAVAEDERPGDGCSPSAAAGPGP
jgi:ABC-2 type transport system ATP-binding protein